MDSLTVQLNTRHPGRGEGGAVSQAGRVATATDTAKTGRWPAKNKFDFCVFFFNPLFDLRKSDSVKCKGQRNYS